MAEHNPEVDWETGQVTLLHCPSNCQESPVPPAPPVPKMEVEKEGNLLLELGDGIFVVYLPDKGEVAHLWATFSQQLAQEAAGPPPSEQSFEDLVLEPYQDSRMSFQRMHLTNSPHANPGTMASS